MPTLNQAARRGTENVEYGRVNEDQGLLGELAPSQKSTVKKIAAGALGATMMLGMMTVFMTSVPAEVPVLGDSSDTETIGTPNFDEAGRYVLTDYDQSKPFASFLPSVNGKYGMPMWSFYVNRGQAITSFGLANKDGPISQFKSATRAYQETEYTGFRSFLKIGRGDKPAAIYEPFSSVAKHAVHRDMAVGMNEVAIVDKNTALGLQTDVTYFTMPDTDYPAFVRRATFTNTDESESVSLEVLDGIAQIEPYGVDDWTLKNQGRNLEGWMNVYNLDEDAGLPWFKLSSDFKDSAEVNEIVEGNFAVSWVEGDEDAGPLPQVVDPFIVFGDDTSMRSADGFVKAGAVDALLAEEQTTASRTPCSFAAKSITLAAGESVTINSVYGHAYSLSHFTETVAPQVMEPSYIQEAYERATALTDDLTEQVATTSSSKLFDSYVRQMHLDNLLRGGYPLMLGTSAEDAKPYHIYSRIHGDTERDYNNFQLEMTAYFQGPGNFRDVNQNRRTDVLQDPRVGDFNLRMFLALTQADGYNPLSVNGAVFVLDAEGRKSVAAKAATGNDTAVLEALLRGPQRPGSLLKKITDKQFTLAVEKDEFIDLVVGAATEYPSATYAQDGFWADHWTYDMDLVDTYLAVFPDKQEALLWDSEPVPFYMSPGRVVARDQKYVLKDAAKGIVRQFGAVVADPSKLGVLADRAHFGNGGTWQTMNGTDVAYTVSPIAKLLLLGVVKFSMLDPAGMGVEMEAGKPGWNDAMNGLPGMIGSGMPETFELLRLLRFCKKAVKAAKRSVKLHVELGDLLSSLLLALGALGDDDAGGSSSDGAFTYWDASRTALETYREATAIFFAGSEATWGHSELGAALELMIAKVETGVTKALAMNNNTGIAPAYFAYPAASYELTGEVETADTARPFVTVTAFDEPVVFPNFLEGPVRHLKTITDKEERAAVYQAVKGSELYDVKLQQYLISGTLSGVVGNDVGRMVAFSPGWLENESIWLHMSYKYYLELLRGGLYPEFWEEMLTGLVAFMDPKIYARSPLECASFIASSKHMDKNIHGTGFLARLSGSTAEFLSMFHTMMAGMTPFEVDESTGELSLAFEPALPSWLFDATEDGDDATLSFTFLGKIAVTYHNAGMVDSWDAVVTSSTLTLVDGSTLTIDGPTIAGGMAEAVRNLTAVTAIDVTLE